MGNALLTKLTTWGEQPHYISKTRVKDIADRKSDEYRLAYLNQTNQHCYKKNLLVKA